jgi:hypothetical protein
MRLLRVALVTLVVAGIAATACVSPQSDVAAVIAPPEAGPSVFVVPDAGGDAATDVTLKGQCVATECPAGFDTCPGNGRDLVFKCQTNLLTDEANCGTCGNACPTFDPLGAASSCENGLCKLSCAGTGVADCDGIVDNGCEVYLTRDPKNCGKCGNACADGVRCFNGKCGCDAGLTDCDGFCVDLTSNNNNCGACGVVCSTPDDAGPPPPNMAYGCGQGTCGKIGCLQSYSDCNKDYPGPTSDGCEVQTGYDDPANCGACGNVCGPDQVCWDFDADGTPSCGCSPTETYCPVTMECVDVATDTLNCGACDLPCSTVFPHTVSVCRKGLCDQDCETGWSDCDGDVRNGCETNTQADGANCGTCGHACDLGAGQPCIAGSCLTTECDGGTVK